MKRNKEICKGEQEVDDDDTDTGVWCFEYIITCCLLTVQCTAQFLTSVLVPLFVQKSQKRATYLHWGFQIQYLYIL